MPDRKDANPYGDEGGKRVGRPSKPKRAADQATDKQADGDPATNPSKSTQAGQEAARGIHGANQGGDGEQPGSEPLEERSDEHVSGYGGNKGDPKRSSD
jgi:hypothetical protein